MGIPSSTREPVSSGRAKITPNYIRYFVLLILTFLIIHNYLWFGRATPNTIVENDERSLQDVVTWDEHSLYINGERVMIMSGEFHPWRLPVPSLWLDIFQKIKAMGFNCVSFYSNWALLEGKPGNFSAEGVFAYEQFFEAATKAGVYLIAVSLLLNIYLKWFTEPRQRPGPYINAEVSFGGFPGWLQRIKGHFRTPDKDYLAATDKSALALPRILS